MGEDEVGQYVEAGEEENTDLVRGNKQKIRLIQIIAYYQDFT